MKPLIESCCRLEKRFRTLLITTNESEIINDIVDCHEVCFLPTYVIVTLLTFANRFFAVQCLLSGQIPEGGRVPGVRLQAEAELPGQGVYFRQVHHLYGDEEQEPDLPRPLSLRAHRYIGQDQVLHALLRATEAAGVRVHRRSCPDSSMAGPHSGHD